MHSCPKIEELGREKKKDIFQSNTNYKGPNIKKTNKQANFYMICQTYFVLQIL